MDFAKLGLIHSSSLCLRNQQVMSDLLLPDQAVQLVNGLTTRIQLFQGG